MATLPVWEGLRLMPLSDQYMRTNSSWHWRQQWKTKFVPLFISPFNRNISNKVKLFLEGNNKACAAFYVSVLASIYRSIVITFMKVHKSDSNNYAHFTWKEFKMVKRCSDWVAPHDNKNTRLVHQCVVYSHMVKDKPTGFTHKNSEDRWEILQNLWRSNMSSE